jgi:hypothetical protein
MRTTTMDLIWILHTYLYDLSLPREYPLIGKTTVVTWLYADPGR